MNEMEMNKNEYREDRKAAYAELSERLGNMINELERLKEKTDWAAENNQRVNISTHHIAMLMSSMMMINNAVARAEKDNEALTILTLLGDAK